MNLKWIRKKENQKKSLVKLCNGSRECQLCLTVGRCCFGRTCNEFNKYRTWIWSSRIINGFTWILILQVWTETSKFFMFLTRQVIYVMFCAAWEAENRKNSFVKFQILQIWICLQISRSHFCYKFEISTEPRRFVLNIKHRCYPW